MPPKTIYVRDAALWDRAKELAEHNEGLSGVISDLLKEWVSRRAAMTNQGDSEVELWVGGESHQRAHPDGAPSDDVDVFVAFTGRLIADSDWGDGRFAKQMPRVHVYLTSKKRLIVYQDCRATVPSEGATYLKFPDFRALQARSDALHTVWIDYEGEYFESPELDADFLRQVAKALGERLVLRID